MAARLDVPRLVRERAVSSGSAGRRWLDELPDVVDTLAARWGLDHEDAIEGGTASFVAATVTADGSRCVLKVGMPLDAEEREAFARSVRVHQLAAGRGCARLLAHDLETSAMLLERLGPNLDELGMALPELLGTVVATLQTFWQPRDASIDLPTGADKAEWLARYITTLWHELDHPGDRRVIDRALDLCEKRRALYDEARAVLVHGDAHGWNTLDAGDGLFKFVDPEGMWSEPAHDLSVAMREYNEPLLEGDTSRLVRDRAEYLASACGADPEAVWEWGFIERVSTGLASVRHFRGVGGLAFLEVARRCF